MRPPLPLPTRGAGPSRIITMRSRVADRVRQRETARRTRSVREVVARRRERSRKPEPGEDGVLESGHRTDPVTAESQHVEAGPVALAARGAKVCPERRLTVGSRWDEVEHPAGSEQRRTE